jgi:hypothetical protein
MTREARPWRENAPVLHGTTDRRPPMTEIPARRTVVHVSDDCAGLVREWDHTTCDDNDCECECHFTDSTGDPR